MKTIGLKETIYYLHKKYGLQYPLYNFLSGFEYRFVMDKNYVLKEKDFTDLTEEDIELLERDVSIETIIKIFDNDIPSVDLKQFMTKDGEYTRIAKFENKFNKFIDVKIHVSAETITPEIEEYIYDSMSIVYPQWKFYNDTLMTYKKLLKCINFTDYTIKKAENEDLESAVRLYNEYNKCNMIIDLITFFTEYDFKNCNKLERELRAMEISPFTSNLKIDMNIDFFNKEILNYKFLGIKY